MLKSVQLITGLLLLVTLELLRVYFIMPFPGSQHDETISIAYFLHSNIFYFRTVGMLLILFPIVHFFWMGSTRSKILTGVGILLYGYVFYLFNFKFAADKIFYEPAHKVFAAHAENKIAGKDLVLGVSINNESKAYPIEVIGYHHQVRDTVSNTPVMITYCTVCRTGRVYSPEVNGKAEQFRLVGMDHFNAMFEDATTRSWWRQVTGEAIAGPLKGTKLNEIFSEQMTLQAWLELHPQSKIMQPDTSFTTKYEHLKTFDEGTGKNKLEKRDSLSWKEKSWIVGVQLGMAARAYDWNELLRHKVLNDTLAAVPIIVVVEPDSISHHVWRSDTLRFVWDLQRSQLKDVQTQSYWSLQGTCMEGKSLGKQLPIVQSYQEFWHSWRTFRPQTTQYTLKSL